MSAFAPGAVYLACFATSALCAALLARAYLRSRSSLLLGTAIGFAFLCLNNLLLVADLMVLPASVDLSGWREASALSAIAVMVFTFTGEAR